MRFLPLLAAVLLCTSAQDARSQTRGASLRVTDANGGAITSMIVPKGISTQFVARATGADGNPIPVEWRAEPAGNVRLDPGADGRVTVTPLRDVFDDSQRREPVTRVQACTPTLCAAVVVTAVPDITGRWPTTLNVEGLLIPHSEQRNLVFNQRGRDVTFDPEPGEAAAQREARLATIRIEGTSLRLVRNGSIMTVFEGQLNSRTTASGRWASSRGYHGSWRAAKSP